MDEMNGAYKAILEGIELAGRVEALLAQAECRLDYELDTASNLSSSDNRQKKLESMKECIALSKLIKVLKYLKGDTIPETEMHDLDRYLTYVLSAFK